MSSEIIDYDALEKRRHYLRNPPRALGPKVGRKETPNSWPVYNHGDYIGQITEKVYPHETEAPWIAQAGWYVPDPSAHTRSRRVMDDCWTGCESRGAAVAMLVSLQEYRRQQWIASLTRK